MLSLARKPRDHEMLREVVSPGAGAITIDNIPQEYRHLRLALQGRTDLASVEEESVAIRFNNDSGSNYDYQSLSASVTTIASGELFGLSLLYLGVLSAADATAAHGGFVEAYVPNYSGATFHKQILHFFANNRDDETGGKEIGRRTSFWRNAAPITRIDLIPISGGNFVAGTVVTLYGEL